MILCQEMFLKYMSSSRGCGRWLDRKKWSFPAVRKDSSLPLGRIMFATQCTFSVFWGLQNYNHSTLARNSPRGCLSD